MNSNFNQETKANVKYKDSLFRKLFGENKTNALSLYNALNGSSYTNEEDLEFTTLEDVIYMKMKNDVSVLFGTSLSLYEHQSSYNPNMPLRGFLYFADLYRKMIKDNERIYSKKMVRIPNPKYIVFYNGPDTSMDGDMQKLKLSDSFEEADESGEFEWTATMLNINIGHNRDILEKCRILEEYSIFIQRVREYNRNSKDLTTAINKAVDECIKDNILKNILESQKMEGINVVLTEFDEEKFENMLREEGREEGRREGLQQGEFIQLCKLVSKKLLPLDVALQESNLSEIEFLELMKKHGLSME